MAQYLLWVMVVGFGAVWLLLEPRKIKITAVVEVLVGVVLGLVFLLVAKSVHHDPRPFVVNAHVTPWFTHSADDGFPSDHSVAAGLIAVLVLWRHRRLGVALSAAAVAIAWARVAAHVHHLQDVVAGLAVGALAGVLALLVAHAVIARVAPDLLLIDSDERTVKHRRSAYAPMARRPRP